MMVVFILVGAILAGVILQGVEFILLGGFLGFLLERLNQLSKQVSLLNQGLEQQKHKSVNNAIFQNKAATQNPAKNEQEKSSLVTVDNDLPESSDATQSTAKSAQTNKSETSISANNEIEPKTIEMIEKNNEIVSQPILRVSAKDKATVKDRVAHEPDIISKAINYIVSYFTQGNIVVRVGAVILFFGVAFLLKYAAENSNISMEFRLTSVVAAAVGLLIFGWRLRNKNQGYGLILQGTAVGILYLTLFASFRLYSMLPAGFSFSLLILFSGLAMTLAVLQNSLSLAVLSITGGFLAPVLTSTGAGSHVALFSYYAVLNIGIFSVAWFKSWRLLNLVGFVFTFLIGTAWGVTKYHPGNFISTEPFLILFFLLYSAIALLFATKQTTHLKGYLDATLVFGLPLISFALQAAMVKDYEYGLAWSSFALGGFYLLLAYIILKRGNTSLRVIAEAYLALGVIFVSLVIPFALDGQWTAASWAIEGAGLIWVGLRQNRWFPKYFGALIQLAGGFIFIIQMVFNHASSSIFNSDMLGVLFVSTAALFTSFQIWKRKSILPQFEALSYLIFLIWGLLWWYFGGTDQITSHLYESNEINGLILFVSLSGLMGYAIERYYHWPVLRHLMWLSLIFLIFIGLVQVDNNGHLFKSWSTLFWTFSLASFYWCLYSREKLYFVENMNSQEKQIEPDIVNMKTNPIGVLLLLPIAHHLLHFCSFIMLVVLSVIEVNWVINYLNLGDSSWGVALLGMLGALWLFLISFSNRWPMIFNTKIYLVYGVNVLLFAGIFWSIFINFSNSGQALPLIFVPVLNPLDVAQGFLLVMAYQSVQKQIREGFSIASNVPNIVMLSFIFIWLNIMLLRSIHAWFSIPYHLDNLFSSFLVQTSLSIFWTIIGLMGTIFAAKHGSRKIWIVAVSLIGVVVLKLFTIDLDASSSIERIVSFVVVGLLLLIVGYFSPLPAKQGLNIAGEEIADGEKENNPHLKRE